MSILIDAEISIDADPEDENMSMHYRIVMVVALLALAGCGGKPQSTATAPEAAPPPPAETAAPAATPPATPAVAEIPAAEPAVAEDPVAVAKRKKVEFALSEQAIAEDPKGQWAATATASTTYKGAKDQEAYAPWQATGAANVIQMSDDPKSWAPAEADTGIEWLEVGFARPVNATEIRVRQNFGPGAIIKLELIDDKGAKHSVFAGVDERKYDEWTWWFNLSFEKTPYLVSGAKITLATNAVSGWNEIDAVQLIGE